MEPCPLPQCGKTWIAKIYHLSTSRRLSPIPSFLFLLSVADLCKCRAYAGDFHEVSAMHACSLTYFRHVTPNMLCDNLHRIFSMPSFQLTRCNFSAGVRCRMSSFFPTSLPNLCPGIDGYLPMGHCHQFWDLTMLRW